MTDDEMELDRRAHLDAILDSEASKKVVLAGPGTGKSFTFRQVVERMPGDVLVLSFLRRLVQDLQDDLGDAATVRTFHEYSKGQLHQMSVPGIGRDFDYYPPVKFIQGQDVSLLKRDAIDSAAIDRALMYIDDTAGLLTAAIDLGNYYNAVGHNDAVYRVYQAFVKSVAEPPAYGQVLVDEYQDFSLLEVCLIDELARQSPVLMAGDDDQALFDFRHAAPEHLRELVSGNEYTRFDLPYCSRCTSVMVEALHGCVARAQERGNLADRLEKKYVCYLPDKRLDSQAYPTITYAKCSTHTVASSYMFRYVAEQIAAIPAEDIERARGKGYPTALVLAPTFLPRPAYNYFADSGIANVQFVKGGDLPPALLDGYLRIGSNDVSRLGWRILVYELQPEGWQEAVTTAITEDRDLHDFLNSDFVEEQRRIAATLRSYSKGQDVEVALLNEVLDALGLTETELRVALRLEVEESRPDPVAALPDVLVTSMVGAKGLQAEHVYVLGMIEGHFPRNNADVEDEEVCQLLVALTRGKKRCVVVGTGRLGGSTPKESIFIDWLRPFLEEVYVSKAYWGGT